jgi:ABC-type lipoprotein release transport system permease subunit
VTVDDLRLAWRNLWRNRTRTAIAAAAISLGLASLLIAFGLAEASHRRVLAVAVRTAGGSVLVHAEGWQRSRAPELLVDDPARLEALARRLPVIQAVIPRVIVQGLLASPRGAAPIQLSGIDPRAQAALLDLAPFIAQGTFLGPGEARPLVIGPGLARRLAVGIGDRVVLTASDRRGDLARALFLVSGILAPRAGLEEGVAYTSLEAAAKAIGAGAARTELGLVLADDARREEVAAALRASLGGGQRLELVTWDEALPEVLAAIRADAAVRWIFGLVVSLVTAFGVANALLMSVLERVRELGLLSALGVTPARAARLVLAETALLATVSIGLGYGLGLAAHLCLSRWGLDPGGLSGAEIEVAGVMIGDLRLRSAIDAWRWTAGGVGVAVMVLLSAGYPALRAARLDPVQAMRTYE